VFAVSNDRVLMTSQCRSSTIMASFRIGVAMTYIHAYMHAYIHTFIQADENRGQCAYGSYTCEVDNGVRKGRRIILFFLSASIVCIVKIDRSSPTKQGSCGFRCTPAPFALPTIDRSIDRCYSIPLFFLGALRCNTALHEFIIKGLLPPIRSLV
jgi:hypothetical protein